MSVFDMLKDIRGVDETALERARARQRELAKPMGSLGQLEEMSVKISGITGRTENSMKRRILFLFGADNGVYEEGVSASPRRFTRDLMRFYADGRNCAINVLCRRYGVDLKLIDVGVDGDIGAANVAVRKTMRRGTENFLKRPAMSRRDMEEAIEVGFSCAEYAKAEKYDVMGNGEVGMGNTTTSAACVMALCGITEADGTVGRGGGLSDEAFAIKKRVITEALHKYGFSGKSDPTEVLRCVGGLDIAAMTGLYLGAAYYRIPVVIDGLISAAAALTAFRISPKAADFMFPSHVSEEPLYSQAVESLGLKAFLRLDMRLGEGSGCPVAMDLLETACAILNGMDTFSGLALESGYRETLKMK